jgi:hypothetical protein
MSSKSRKEKIMTLAHYILNDFRRLFEQEETRFDVDEFIQYVEAHAYTTDYDHLKGGFIRKKVAEEQFAYHQQKRTEAEDAAEQAAEECAEHARQLEAEAKQSALQEYIDAGFSPESFEADWPAIRARLAAEKIAERRNRAANPRLYIDGYVPGGCSENITRPSQG